MPNIIVPHSEEKDLYKIVSALRNMGEAIQPMRTVRTSNATYYVATTGSDTANDGLSASSPFLTVNKAIDTIAALDLSIYAGTINVAAGTYTTPIVLKSYLGVGPITIIGDETTPANCAISTTSADCITADGVIGLWELRGLKYQTTTGGYGIRNVFSNIKFQNCEFGTTVNSHMICDGGRIRATGSYKVSGGSVIHAQPFAGGIIDTSGRTVTITNTPTISNWAFATNTGGLYAYNMTFSGAVSASSSQGIAAFNGWVDTQGALNLPGTAGGSALGGIFF